MRVRSPWLGDQRGYLVDWLTQQWVRASGDRVLLADHPWLEGPVGTADRIGHDFFETFAVANGMRIRAAESELGLMPDFDALRSEELDPGAADAAVRRFYERTAGYRLEVSSQWSGLFRPFGWALAALFSRRLEQLNMPMSSPSTSADMTSSILVLEDAETGRAHYTAWVRSNQLSGETVYAASYSVTDLPGHTARFVKVVFPLPNGCATVILRPTVLEDRSLLLQSRGVGFGDPGFYFVVRAPQGDAWVRSVNTFHEEIRVYVDDEAELRADHDFHIWGQRFLRLHYRMRAKFR